MHFYTYFSLLVKEPLFLLLEKERISIYYKRSTGILLIQTATIKAQQVTYESKFWMIWRTTITPTTYLYCASMNGRILSISDPVINSIPVHPNSKCFLESLMAIADRDHRLPDAPERIRYEADFDYTGGFRNDCRLMYSNDGLIFVTYIGSL